MEGQVSIFDPDSWSGNKYPEPFPRTAEKISGVCCRSLSASRSRKPLMCLSLKENGPEQGFSWENDGALHGEYSTRNFGEFPNAAAESRLSQILEANAPEKYCLSAKALRGIKTRAERRGKALPPVLEAAIDFQIALREAAERNDGTPETIGAILKKLVRFWRVWTEAHAQTVART